MSRGAREDSKDVRRARGAVRRWEANPLRNTEQGLEGRETVEDSYYYQFACLRSLDLPLSSFHLDDARGLFPPIYFLDPNRRLANHLPFCSNPTPYTPFDNGTEEILVPSFRNAPTQGRSEVGDLCVVSSRGFTLYFVSLTLGIYESWKFGDNSSLEFGNLRVGRFDSRVILHSRILKFVGKL